MTPRTPAASLKDRYRWVDVSAMRKPKPVTPAAGAPGNSVTPGNIVTAPGWSESNGNDGLGTGASGPGISPSTAGALGAVANVGAALTRDANLGALGGLLGIAGSENPAASMAGAAGALAVGGGLAGGIVGGAIAGGINNGVEGAVKGAATGGALSAIASSGPIGLLGVLAYGIDATLNGGKAAGAFTDMLGLTTNAANQKAQDAAYSDEGQASRQAEGMAAKAGSTASSSTSGAATTSGATATSIGSGWDGVGGMSGGAEGGRDDGGTGFGW